MIKKSLVSDKKELKKSKAASQVDTQAIEAVKFRLEQIEFMPVVELTED